MNNTLLRAITGFFFVASILLPIWFNNYIAVGVFSIFFIAALIEFGNLFNTHAKIEFNKVGFLVSSILIYALSAWIILYSFDYFLFTLIIPVVFLFILSELWRNKKEPIYNISTSIFGLFYILVPFILILLLVQINENSKHLLIGMFLLIWSNDTFAYLSGRIFGKTKLFERISPKKTWEGTLGGIIVTIGIGILFGMLNNGNLFYFWIVSACIVAPCAIFGDLLESLMKRNLNIKDSGNILPGHGGILDRFDATLFTVPFFFTWVLIYNLYFS
ncbi:MAG: phosphatidate cytidylyltransferase [Flavobacteriia bacterium]|jgi:phosphatidate cytidylyltransferase